MEKIINFKDGLQVEVEVDSNKAQEIADFNDVEASINQLNSFISKVVKPVSTSYSEISESIEIETMKVKIGVKVGVEGNFILAKSSANANIEIELTLKAKKDI